MYNKLIYTNNKVIIDTVQGLSKNNVKETLHREIDWIIRNTNTTNHWTTNTNTNTSFIKCFWFNFLKQTSIFKLGHKHYLNVILTDNGWTMLNIDCMNLKYRITNLLRLNALHFSELFSKFSFVKNIFSPNYSWVTGLNWVV